MDTIAEPGMPPSLEWQPVVAGMLALRWTRYPRVEHYAATVWRDRRAECVQWTAQDADGDWLGAGRLPDGPGAIEEAQAMCLRVLRAWARNGRT